MKPEGIDVQLGEHSYRVRPQRMAYLKRSLGKFGEEAQEALSGGTVEGFSDIIDLVTDRAYEFLSIFIPDLMPEWEWNGYDSEADANSGHYVEDRDQSPTQPQIKAAFEAAVQVNDFEWLKKVGNAIGTDFLKAQMRLALLRVTTPESSTTSPSLPPQNGESAQTSSGTTAPTSVERQPIG